MSRLCVPKRYQLRKESVLHLQNGHPWIFRGQMSSASLVFEDGQWLALYDHQNTLLGYGMYESQGAVAIRIFSHEPELPTSRWFAAILEKALQKRQTLLSSTNGIRWIHGESDGFPAVVFDAFADVGILQTYSQGSVVLGRWVAQKLLRKGLVKHVIWKPAKRSVSASGAQVSRVLAGQPPQEVTVTEPWGNFSVSLGSGQKSGSFLDLRNLRQRVSQLKLSGKRVLNLFSYTGNLGIAAHHAGASEIIHVDSSRPALEFGKAHHQPSGMQVDWLEQDGFAPVPSLAGQTFDVVICDPPQMTSKQEQVDRALATYKKVYSQLGAVCRSQGFLFACCCTSRISAKQFTQTVAVALGPQFVLVERLAHEVDHPVGFPQADYLKVLQFQRK